jgi:brefeldin A-inhibited guanine nucleotide-exchange protein
MNAFAMRTKIIGLELILTVLNKPGPTFLDAKEPFIDLIKNSLCDGLLKYSVSTERSIFSLVVSIFWNLYQHFRVHLKQETFVFIDRIFLKLLQSGNSSFHHKQLILTVFDKMTQETRYLLELFVNFDCDIGCEDITNRMIETLSRIATGKFTKIEH